MKTAKNNPKPKACKQSKASVFERPPLDMDRDSRNERLYPTLLSMGLFVEPVPGPGPAGGIAKFIVSC